MSSRLSKNNVLAGLFLLVSLVLFVTVVIILSSLGETLSEKKAYTVAFSLEDGAEGLEKGAPVKLGGKLVGRVTSSSLAVNPSGDPTSVDVAIAIRADVRLHKDAIILLAKPLLGSNSSLNIVAVSGLGAEDPTYTGPTGPAAEGDRLVGRLGAPGFLSRSDYQKIRSVISRVDKMTADIEPQVKPIVDDARASVSNVRTITDDAAKRWPQWGDKVDKTFADFEPIVKSVREFVDKAQGVIDRNTKPFEEIVENVRVLTAKAKGEGYEEVMSAVRRGREGLDSFAAAAKRVDELVTTKAPELEDLVTNGALAAQQLKLTTMEIRASPWRLLYQPTKKELENELLYNSVRSYSMAIAELHQASQSLDAVSARIEAARASGGAVPEVDQRTIDELSKRLRESFEHYQQQEREFLDRWIKK